MIKKLSLIMSILALVIFAGCSGNFDIEKNEFDERIEVSANVEIQEETSNNIDFIELQEGYKIPSVLGDFKLSQNIGGGYDDFMGVSMYQLIYEKNEKEINVIFTFPTDYESMDAEVRQNIEDERSYVEEGMIYLENQLPNSEKVQHILFTFFEYSKGKYLMIHFTSYDFDMESQELHSLFDTLDDYFNYIPIEEALR